MEEETSQNIDGTSQFLRDDLNMANLSDSYLDNGIPSPADINTLSLRILQVEKRLENFKSQNNNLRYEIDELKTQLEETWEATEALERDLGQFQQYNRRQNVEISGLPESIPNAELENVIISILRRIGVYQLEAHEIVACHRLKKKKNDKTCPVIIRFVNRKRALQCLYNRKHIRDTIHEYPNIYIHENLCPRYKSIFEECHELKINNNIKKI